MTVCLEAVCSFKCVTLEACVNTESMCVRHPCSVRIHVCIYTHSLVAAALYRTGEITR